jgi:isocitrate lyase
VTQRALTHACAACVPQAELAAEGRTATKHQREEGTGNFGAVSTVVSAGPSSMVALVGSTEASYFIAKAC